MEVSKITAKSGAASVASVAKNAQNVSFGALDAYASKETKKLAETIKEAMPPCIKGMEKLICLKGEAGGIIINALGTGLVAPIFIAYNPLSKTDEKTKKYTALRQPVSAILAILIQAGLTKPLSQLYDYLANEGKLGSSLYLDKSILKDKDYFIKQFKQFKPLSITPEEYANREVAKQTEQVIKTLEEEGLIRFSKDKVLKGNDLISLINKTLETYKTDVTEKLDETKKKDIDYKVARAKLLVSDKNEKPLKEICEKILSLEDKAKLKKELAQWLNSDDDEIKKLATEFLEKNSVQAAKHRAEKTVEKMNLYGQRIIQCKEIGTNSSHILGKLTEIATNDKADVSGILAEVKSKYKGNPNAELIFNMFNELHASVDKTDRKEYANTLIEAVKKLEQAGDDKFKIIEVFQRAYYKTKVTHLENKLKVLDGLKINTKTNITESKDIIKRLKESIKSFNQHNFTEDMVKTWKEAVNGRFKGFKQITNILVGLAITLPVTCTALNWVYPRFMDIFFPSLAHDDKCNAPEEQAKANKAGGTK